MSHSLGYPLILDRSVCLSLDNYSAGYGLTLETAYHIHTEPVPANGDCYATGSHLDPYNRGETPLCNAGDPSTCQIGDLSGKHGNATDTTFSAEYTDVYLSNIPGNSAFIGNRSIVIHASNGTRLNCGNFQAAGGAVTPSHPPTGQTSTRVAPTTLTTTHSVPTGTTSPHSALTQTTSTQSNPTRTTSIHPISIGTTSTHSTSVGTTPTYSISTRPTVTQAGPTTLSTRTLPTPSTSTVR